MTPRAAKRGMLCLLGAALMFGAYASAAEAQRLGRLFSTPEERARLEELRRERDIVDPEPQAVIQRVEDVPAVEQLTIDGLVIRSSGADSAWINGRPVSGGARSREGVHVETTRSRGGRVKITLPSGADTVELKPGQKIDVDSGVVVESYERGSGAGAESVFDRVVSEAGAADAAASPGAVQEPPEAGEQNPPDTRRGVRYPEAFLEQIRRMLKGG